MPLKPLRIAAFAFISALTLAACQNTPSTTGTTPTSPEKPPIPKKNTGPVTIQGNCQQRDETDGYRDKISIAVKDNVVSALDWTANPRSGSCRFQLKDFTQVSSSPTADLQSKKDKNCHLYVWQDDHHITVASYSCRKLCRVNDKILPVLLDPQTGNCKAK
ncbi:hypothetical protein [Hydromonas duriensis]|uniref:Lipoprotein n=1 Tax=Hydromonas duriensis TaxID=1527608 RepID=A0A4R6Y7Q5_9BURK|nr:hypothetical protein [Hydromonas duriensis]TDR31388.1 hypothetical protein DFR44_11036 [Hydromonas duriensis]